MLVTKKMFAGLSVACLLSVQAVVPAMAKAAPLRVNTGMSAMFGNHMVKISVHNATGAALQLKVGDAAMTINAGQTMSVSGADGAAVIVTAATKDYAAGDVLAKLSKDLSGATITVN